MLFEVLRDGKALMTTDDESGIYDLETLKSMQGAGYKFRMNGKAWVPREKPQHGATRVDGQLSLTDSIF